MLRIRLPELTSFTTMDKLDRPNAEPSSRSTATRMSKPVSFSSLCFPIKKKILKNQKTKKKADMTFQGEAVNGTIRTYTFAIDSKYGCVSGGSSGGFCTACFLFRFLPTLFLLLAIVGYIVIGIIVKVVVMKGRGLDIFPNITFWKKVPFLIKEGILLIVLDGIVGGIQKLRRKDYQPK